MIDPWWLDASCREYPVELFFTETSGWGKEHEEIIRLICGVCPVLEECLESAMAEEKGAGSNRHGIRGGMLPSQRLRHYKSILDRGAGWCVNGLHIVEHDEEGCQKCGTEKKLA